MKMARFALIVLSVLFIASCGGGGGGGAASPVMSGQVINGYMKGASVYIVSIDYDIGNIANISQSAKYKADALTDEKGTFSFTGVPESLFSASATPTYKLVAVGGINTSTNESQVNSVSVSPINAKVITPLTTLAMNAVASKASASGSAVTQTMIDDALNSVAAASGMDANGKHSILNTDFIASAGSDSNAVKALTLDLVITQLEKNNILGSGSLATALAVPTAKFNDISTLLTSAAGSNATKVAQASVLAASVQNSISSIVTLSQSVQQTSVDSAATMKSLEGQLNNSIKASIPSVNSSNIAEVTNTISSAATASVINSVPALVPSNKSGQPADLTNSTVRSYLLAKASDGGIAELLGFNIKTVQSGTALPKMVARASGNFGKSTSKSVAAASVNPCATAADTSLAINCADVFGSEFCANSTSGYQGTVTCLAKQPTKISISLTNFSAPIFDSKLSGNIEISSNTMSFDNVTNGTTSFNGAISYSQGADSSLVFAVKSMAVTSPMWKSLLLDSFSNGRITPAATNNDKNRMNIFLSGAGTPAASNISRKLSLSYERSQDAVKKPSGSQFIDNASVILNGQIIEGTELTTLSGFGVSEARFYNSLSDQDYLYKLSSFNSGSKLSSSLYGYAYYKGSDIRFDYNKATAEAVYKSGTLSLTSE